MELAQNIKRRRIELNLSQSELASKVGYKDKGSISRIENGTLDLTQSQIVNFAKALEVSPAYLMGWENQNDKDKLLESLDKMKEMIIKSELLNITEAEAEIIKNIRKLDAKGRSSVLRVIDDELRYLRMTKYISNLKEIKHGEK